MTIATTTALQLAGRAKRGDNQAIQNLLSELAKGGVYRTSAGNPNTSVTPNSIGERLFDTTNLIFYTASNLTNAGWIASGSAVNAALNTNTATAGATLTAGNVSGSPVAVDLAMTGTLGGAANAQMPTVAALVAVMQSPVIGSSYRLRVTNQSSANFAWTITTNTGWTLTGTMSIAQNTWREFVVTLTSLTAATLTSVAVGTYS